MPAVLRACLQFEFPAPAQRGRGGAPLEKGVCLFQGNPGWGWLANLVIEGSPTLSTLLHTPERSWCMYSYPNIAILLKPHTSSRLRWRAIKKPRRTVAILSTHQGILILGLPHRHLARALNTPLPHRHSSPRQRPGRRQFLRACSLL